jgi:DNA-binding FrmR family transcriptional regulator
MRRASRTVSARIHRLVGQLNAVEEMLANKRTCADVLTQIGAIRAGIEGVSAIVFQRELERLRQNRRVTSDDIAKLTALFTKTT